MSHSHTLCPRFLSLPRHACQASSESCCQNKRYKQQTALRGSHNLAFRYSGVAWRTTKEEHAGTREGGGQVRLLRLPEPAVSQGKSTEPEQPLSLARSAPGVRRTAARRDCCRGGVHNGPLLAVTAVRLITPHTKVWPPQPLMSPRHVFSGSSADQLVHSRQDGDQ